MSRFAIVMVCCAFACGDDGPRVQDAAVSKNVEVLRIPVVVNRDVDMLFMIDDSTALDDQVRLKASFPMLISTLDTIANGLPNVHIGVVTSDLGTMGAGDAQPGPPIGSGPGACNGQGKQGNLQTYGSTLVTGSFISDTENTDGTRSTNYTGTLAAAYGEIASVGAGGCGFEQSLDAVKRALNNNPANAGFLRPAANLMVVLFTDEDDCSMEHSSLLGTDPSLGPLQSFRCTRFGITCDGGGTTPDQMNIIGAKEHCHSNEESAYLTRAGDYVTFLQGLKATPDRVMVAALVGDAAPVVVEGRAPPGGGATIPALAHSCMYVDTSNGTVVADPAVRVTEFATVFPRHVVRSICGDLSAALADVAYELGGLVGSPCLTQEIVDPPSCTVTDVTAAGTTVLPPCPVAGADCYQLVADATTCPLHQHLKLQVTRTIAPSPSTVTTVTCLVP